MKFNSNEKNNQTISFSKSAREVYEKFEYFKSVVPNNGNESNEVVAALLVCAESLYELNSKINELHYYMRSA